MKTITKHYELEQLMGGGAWVPVTLRKEDDPDGSSVPRVATFTDLTEALLHRVDGRTAATSTNLRLITVTTVREREG